MHRRSTWPASSTAVEADAAAFGNVLLAQPENPAVAISSPTPRSSLKLGGYAKRSRTSPATSRSRRRYGRAMRLGATVSTAAQRNRVVDLLCAAPFGLERPARARHLPLNRSLRPGRLNRQDVAERKLKLVFAAGALAPSRCSSCRPQAPRSRRPHPAAAACGQ